MLDPEPISERPWPRKFRDAFRGMKAGVRGQSSFFVHFFMTAAVIVAAMVLRVDLLRMVHSINLHHHRADGRDVQQRAGIDGQGHHRRNRSPPGQFAGHRQRRSAGSLDRRRHSRQHYLHQPPGNDAAVVVINHGFIHICLILHAMLIFCIPIPDVAGIFFVAL